MISIILKDNKNKLLQQLTHLRDETELLICENIFKLNKVGHQLSIESLEEGVTEYWLKLGYIEDSGLYDKLIIDYNQTHDQLLAKWK